MTLLSLHVTAAYQPAQKGNEDEEDDNIPAHTIPWSVPRTSDPL